jgi:hypothetical protein
VHAVVLFFDIVEMFCVLIDSECAKHVLEKQEGVVVLMFNAGSVVEYTDVRVVHLIITDEHESRYVYTLITIGLSCGCGFTNAVEGVVDLSDKLIVVDVACSYDNQIVTEVVGGLISSEIVSGQVAEVISISSNGLAHHVISVGIEV